MPCCMFGCPLSVWLPPICVDAPCMFECPHMFGHLPVCLDAPCTFGCPQCVAAILISAIFIFFHFKYVIHFSKYCFVLDAPYV